MLLVDLLTAVAQLTHHVLGYRWVQGEAVLWVALVMPRAAGTANPCPS